jgi:hypothetical protein
MPRIGETPPSIQKLKPRRLDNIYRFLPELFNLSILLRFNIETSKLSLELGTIIPLTAREQESIF